MLKNATLTTDNYNKIIVFRNIVYFLVPILDFIKILVLNSSALLSTRSKVYLYRTGTSRYYYKNICRVSLSSSYYTSNK